MIVCWRLPHMPDSDFRRVAHCWFHTAAQHGEALTTPDLTSDNLDRYWDHVNLTNGPRVVWVNPCFIPSPAFFDELSYYKSEDFYIVCLRTYDAAFQPGADQPCKWAPNGEISSGLVVFQLTGQQRLQLPSSRRVRDYWHWLARKNSAGILRLGQTYAGIPDVGPMARSNLGVLMPECWDGEYGTFGRVIMGDSRWYSKRALHNHWNERIAAWEHYLK